MNEPAKNPFDLLLESFREIVRQEIRAALRTAIRTDAADSDKRKARKWEEMTEDERAALREKDWLKAGEMAALYGLPQTWFEERGREGQIARTKPGRYVLFKRRDVEAYLKRNKSRGGENNGN